MSHERKVVKVHVVESIQARPEDNVTDEMIDQARRSKGISLKEYVNDEIAAGRSNRCLEHEKRIMELMGEL